MVGDIKSAHCISPTLHHPQVYGKFSMFKDRAEVFSPVQDLGPNNRLQRFGVQNRFGF